MIIRQERAEFQAAETFAERLQQILNHGALNLMISIGHRTGLFDAMSQLPSSSSAEIALVAGLNERYVREWLGAMVTGGVIDYQPPGGFRLPEEHAAILASDGPQSMVGSSQWLSVLAEVEGDIVDRFRRGGGVPHAHYCRLHDEMTEESQPQAMTALERHLLPLAPGLSELLQEGIDVLDVGCGSGRGLMALARRFPKSRFTGVDPCPQAIDKAERWARQLGLTNVHVVRRDAAQLNLPQAFDLVTAFGAMHDQARPDLVLRRIAGALREDGLFLMQDISAASDLDDNLEHPLGPFIYTISCMHGVAVSLAQGGLGLGAAWGRELAQRMLLAAGFRHILIRRLRHDPLNDYYFVRKRVAKPS